MLTFVGAFCRVGNLLGAPQRGKKRRQKVRSATHRSGIEAVLSGRKRVKSGGLEADEKRLKADELPERKSGCKAVEKQLKAADAMA